MLRSRRVLLTMQQRVNVLLDLETCPIACVAEKYGVHPRTIRRIQERAVEIYDFAFSEEKRRLSGLLEEEAAEEGDHERAAEEGEEERAAEQSTAAEEGDQERAEEAEEERAAEEGDRVTLIKLPPKIRQDFEDCFKQLERLKEYLPPPVQLQLKGLKLTVLGYTMSKKRKRP